MITFGTSSVIHVHKHELHILVCADLDASGDGKLSHHELEQALVELDINITTAQAHALVTFMGEWQW